MSSRYPTRKRATVDYAAVNSGRPSRVTKAKPAPPILVSPRTPKSARSSRSLGGTGRRVAFAPIERPEPEPLDQSSDGGPDPPSLDPTFDSSELSSEEVTDSDQSFSLGGVTQELTEITDSDQDLSTEGVTQELTEITDSDEYQSTEEVTQVPTSSSSSLFVNPEPASPPVQLPLSKGETFNEAFTRMFFPPLEDTLRGYERVRDYFKLEEDSENELDEDNSEAATQYTVQELIDLVGTVVTFVRKVKQVPIDITDPSSVSQELDSQDPLWDNTSVNWTKFAHQAWHHRWSEADTLNEMPLGVVTALANEVLRFKGDLLDKGIDLEA
ncbi:hypothetical protein ABKA04_009332 [Annulohypoxylon sp. FPYF3050]